MYVIKAVESDFKEVFSQDDKVLRIGFERKDYTVRRHNGSP